MDVIDRINAHRYLYLTEVHEPRDLLLRLVVTEGRHAQSDHSGPEGLGGPASSYGAIVADERSAAYEIQFDQYIAYAVLNESFTVWDDEEKFEGTLFRTYSQSKFLAYVRAGTIASDDHPGPFKHYGVVCLNHIIEVASPRAPKITMLRASR